MCMHLAYHCSIASAHHAWLAEAIVMLMEEFEVGGKDPSLVKRHAKSRQIMVSRSLQYKQQNYAYIVTPFVLVGYLL